MWSGPFYLFKQSASAHFIWPSRMPMETLGNVEARLLPKDQGKDTEQNDCLQTIQNGPYVGGRISALPPILFFCPLSSKGQWTLANVRGKRNKKNSNRTEVEEEQKVKRERRPCIMLLFSLFLSGWAISRPPMFLRWGLVGGLSEGPLGSVCNVPPYRVLSEGGSRGMRGLGRGAV